VLPPDPPKPVRIVELPKLLPLPGQLKADPGHEESAAGSRADPHAPHRSGQWRGPGWSRPEAGYLNAIQVLSMV